MRKLLVLFLTLTLLFSFTGCYNIYSSKQKETAPVAETTKETTTIETEETKQTEIEEIEQTEKLTFELIAGEFGEYGEIITFNKGIDDGEFSRCIYHIPAGTYKITNIGEYRAQVNIYSDETHITEEGWEEPAEVFFVELLDVNESTILSIEDGRYVYIAAPDKILFEQQ